MELEQILKRKGMNKQAAGIHVIQNFNQEVS